MKAKVDRYSLFSRLETAGKLNRCVCGGKAIYRNSPCGGIHISCTVCDNRTEDCVHEITPESIEFLRFQWNDRLLHKPWSETLMRKMGAENGSLLVARQFDSVLCGTFDYMDEALDFLKSECKRDFTTDYTLLQLIKYKDGFRTEILATSKVLCYVGQWSGFDASKLEEV